MPTTRSLATRQIAIVVLLFVGYGACYFCRADLAVSSPLLIEQLARQGIHHDQALILIGRISSLGVLAYALGKLFLGGLGDVWGGRPNFLIGLGGAAVFTLLFALSGTVPVFTLAWIGNRLTQSLAWAGLIKISGKWFDHSLHGTVIGVLSLSYLVGDAAARPAMGQLIAWGFSWQAVFYFAAAVAAVAFLANAFLLAESRTRAGFAETQANPLNLYGESSQRQPGLRALLGPLLRSPAFLLVCLLSFGCTVVRESFNNWTPVYLQDFLGNSASVAATLSALFPAVGAVSVLVCGIASDRLGVSGRPLLLLAGLIATALALLWLMTVPAGLHGSFVPLIAISLVALCLIGPYSFLGGAFALDFGGKQGGAIASGIIDGIGYLGGALAGDAVARVSVAFGWRGVFFALAACCALSAAAAGYLYALSAVPRLQYRRSS